MANTEAEAPNLQPFCTLSTRQLITVAGGFADELRRRVDLADNQESKRLLLKAAMRLVEAKAYLRQARGLEIPAAPVPTAEHPAPEEGAPTGDTTTAGAAGVLDLRVKEVLILEPPHPSVRLPPFYARQVCPRCVLDFGHEGECRPVAGPETAPTSPSHSEHQASGQRGPKGAEGVGEADRAEQARGELEPEAERSLTLADRLALLKGGVA